MEPEIRFVTPLQVSVSTPDVAVLRAWWPLATSQGLRVVASRPYERGARLTVGLKVAAAFLPLAAEVVSSEDGPAGPSLTLRWCDPTGAQGHFTRWLATLDDPDRTMEARRPPPVSAPAAPVERPTNPAAPLDTVAPPPGTTGQPALVLVARGIIAAMDQADPWAAVGVRLGATESDIRARVAELERQLESGPGAGLTPAQAERVATALRALRRIEVVPDGARALLRIQPKHGTVTRVTSTPPPPPPPVNPNVTRVQTVTRVEVPTVVTEITDVRQRMRAADKVRALAEKGRDAMARREFGDAERLLTQAVERDPTVVGYQVDLAWAVYNNDEHPLADRVPRAKKMLEAATQRGRQPEAHFRLGQLLFEQGDTPGAIRCMRDALHIDRAHTGAALKLKTWTDLVNSGGGT